MTKRVKLADHWIVRFSVGRVSVNAFAKLLTLDKGNLRGNRYSRASFQEIVSKFSFGDRTKTDTGGCEEYSQAREITLVKELCKLPS